MIVSLRKKKGRFFSRRFQTGLGMLGLVAVLFLFQSRDPATITPKSSLLEIPPSTEKLADAVKERSNEIQKANLIKGGYPALSSLVEAVADEQQAKVSLRVTGDVQFLLDYAIVGFSKCGTTTLLKWIRRDPDVRTFDREIHEIIKDNPGRLVERLYQNLVENPPSNATTTNKGVFLQGFKNPEILQTPTALRHLHNYWPETKLIVSVRNPLKWFRSFYNFRLTIGHLEKVGKDPNVLVGHCGNKMLCSHMGAFHVKLFRLGKTAMTSMDELELLKPFLAPPEHDEDKDIWNHIQKKSGSPIIPRMKNKIFFLDLRQLGDPNKTRANLFRRDLQNFLGLRHELSRVFRARPFKQLELTLDEESKQHKMDTICNPKYQPMQGELFSMAQSASRWLRNYFLKSPDVVVSSPEYVEELLQTWMLNPCDEVNPVQEKPY